jgi:hypothetical protein
MTDGNHGRYLTVSFSDRASKRDRVRRDGDPPHIGLQMHSRPDAAGTGAQRRTDDMQLGPIALKDDVSGGLNQFQVSGEMRARTRQRCHPADLAQQIFQRQGPRLSPFQFKAADSRS